MATLRTIAFAMLATVFFAYMLIALTGTYEIQSGTPINASLQQQYGYIVGNFTGNSTLTGGIFGSTVGLYQNTSSSTNTIKGGLGATSIAISTVSFIFNFVPDMLNIFGAMAYFIAVPFTFIGIPATYAVFIGYFMLFVLIFLAIISAILIFPN